MKRSAFSRVIEYFRTADLTEAKAALNTATATVGLRTTSSVPVQKQKRHRRTKAEIAADREHARTAAAGALNGTIMDQ